MRADSVCDNRYLIKSITLIVLSFILLALPACSSQSSNSTDAGNSGYGEDNVTQEELKKSISSGEISDASDIKYNFPKRKPKDESDGMVFDQDTLMWLNATYAIQMEANSLDLYYVAGIHEDRQNEVDGVVDMLRSSWGIKDRKSFIKINEWILDEGHREKYAELVNTAKEQGITNLGNRPLSEYQELVSEKNPKLDEKDVRRMAYAAYMCENEGLESIAFWDYSRAISVLGWSYVAGYITLDEYVQQAVPIGMLIQKEYGGWAEAGKNYLDGYKYWRDQEPESTDVEYIMRQAAYDMLCENPDSIYKIDYNYDLLMK